jgi:hypothetical protein
MAGSPPATGEERVAANVETWRILNGTARPFDADAARRHVLASIARARDFGAAAQHDLAFVHALFRTRRIKIDSDWWRSLRGPASSRES